jgi:hypothetical protein
MAINDEPREGLERDDARADETPASPTEAAERRFQLSGEILVAGRALLGYSANDNGR